MKPNMKNILTEFQLSVKNREIIIYNEISLQHELGIFIRTKIPDHLVQFERNISYFNISKDNSEKREIDISIFSPDKKELVCAVELKFPRNGQYPEAMFSFCKDIAFMEHVKKNGFKQAFLLIFADDHLFYGGASDKPPYNYFRNQIPLTGTVDKPTGKKDYQVNIHGRYIITWDTLYDDLKCSLIEI